MFNLSGVIEALVYPAMHEGDLFLPKWLILGNTSLRNLRLGNQMLFITWTLQLSSVFHFILGFISLLYVLSIHWKMLILMDIKLTTYLATS
jgi:hypothetical protein